MDDVFRALADPTRRRLLDKLFKKDGQTSSALEQRMPMTRFGVMKHLKLLEEAGLVVTRRRGREKLHFLNAVPIRLIHDRWVSKYTEPWAATLSDLKHKLESETMEKVFEIYIKTTPERLWQAITDTEMRAQIHLRRGVTSDWTPGSRYQGVGHGTADLRGRESGGRSAAPTGPELSGAVGRGREGGGDLAGDLGDRAGRQFMPADGHPRSAARGRQQPALRRLADAALRPQDAARDRRDCSPRRDRCAFRTARKP